jgi:hypothetical protein
MRIMIAALLSLGLSCGSDGDSGYPPDGSDDAEDGDSGTDESTVDEAVADAEAEDVPDADVDDRCEAGLTWCDYGSVCVDLQSDPASCGRCSAVTTSTACESDETCEHGVCVCTSPRIICGEGEDAACTDPLNSSWNCGGCYNYGAGPGVRCTLGEACCIAGVCVPLVGGECPR